MDIVKKIEQKHMKPELPSFNVGDEVSVQVKLKEGGKRGLQMFRGTVIKIRGGKGIRGSFTVRRIVQGEGVERVFPFHSPLVVDVKVERPGRVRRAKLYYLRDRVGKATRVKERRVDIKGKGKGKKAKGSSTTKTTKPAETKA